MEWYAVKGIFRWYMKDTGETARFEDRVTLFKATSFDEAIEMAKKEAIEYCEEYPTANYLIESLGIWETFSLQTEVIEQGEEVFSQLFHSYLDAKDYIQKYYPKSEERN